jgi:hypothetical protein
MGLSRRSNSYVSRPEKREKANGKWEWQMGELTFEMGLTPYLLFMSAAAFS